MASATAMFPVLLAACGASDHDPQVLKLSVETGSGVVRFDKARLSAEACSTGRYWCTQHGTLVVR